MKIHTWHQELRYTPLPRGTSSERQTMRESIVLPGADLWNALYHGPLIYSAPVVKGSMIYTIANSFMVDWERYKRNIALTPFSRYW